MNPREEARIKDEEQKRGEQEKARFALALKSVAATADGKRVLSWIIAQGKIISDEFTPSAQHAYNSGLKAVPVRLWQKLREHAIREDFIDICIGEKSNG